MIQDRIKNWYVRTQNNTLTWEATSSVTMFMTHDDERIFSIEMVGDNIYELSEWNDNGDVIDTFASNDNESKNLYDAIIMSNPMFTKRLSEMEENAESIKPQETVSLWKIMHQLGFEKDGVNEYINIKDNKSFFYVTKDNSNYNPNYVEPLFVRLDTFGKSIPLDKAEVILVSAPGATGKSALSAYLSNKMGIPLFDLGRHEAVASHSLVGLFVDNLSTEEYVKFKNGLSQSKYSMIIDGLDEGEIRAGSTSAYESFLVDVVNIAKSAEGTPFLMLGRHRTVMDTVLYLEANDVRVICLQIEPFTLSKASDFIDITMENKDAAVRFEHSYREVRGYIIEQIEGFFKGEPDLKRRSFSRFIGYAPVLMAIAALLDERKDYNKLLQELKDEQKKNIDLVLSIIDKILSRERDKVKSRALPPILENYDKDFVAKIQENAYGIEEQCARILYCVLHKKYNYNVSDRANFNHAYNEKMEEWTKNHPFLDMKDSDNPQIQNIVFESYIVTYLAHTGKHIQIVLDYLAKSKSNSYLLFDFYYRLAKGKHIIDYRLITYLFDSYRALDSTDEISSMEIISTTKEEEFLEDQCIVSFYRNGQPEENEMEFETTIPYDKFLTLPSLLYGITVDIPLPVHCDTQRVDIRPPMSIRCTKMNISSADVVISAGGNNGVACIECEEFSALQNNGNIPHIVDRTNKKALIVRSNQNVLYPFSDYWKGEYSISKQDKDLADKFNKLCRTIVLFRSYGKESLARIQSKIQCRICNTKVGKAVVDKLLSSRIIYKDGIMYVLNTDEMNRQLGMNYNSIHSSELNEKTRKFLEDIKVYNDD